MLSRYAESITQKLLQYDVIKPADKEIYQHGFEAGIPLVINLLSTLVVAYFYHMPVETFTFLFSLLTLRTYTGGYHSHNNIICYIISILLNIVVLTAGRAINNSQLQYLPLILGAIGCVLLIILSPVADANKPLDEIELVIFRRRAMRNLAIWSCIAVILYFTPLKTTSIVLSLCLFIMGITAVIGFMKNHVQKRALSQVKELQ